MQAARATATRKSAAVRASAHPPPPQSAPCADAPPASPADRPGAAASRPASSAAPPFAHLVLVGLECVGITYISMDHLRKAKKSLHTEREYVEFWKLLHDLVLVVLANFDVDADAMRRVNSGDAALEDAASQQIRMELVRYYLYDWGFVCQSFYDTRRRASSQELLLALAWLFAFSKLFARLQARILEDVELTASQLQCVHETVASATAEFCRYSQEPMAFEAQIHQLHAAYGRLASHVSDLKAYMRCHERLLRRLEQLQTQSRSGQTRISDDDDGIPAYAVQLFAKPKNHMEAHLRVLAHSVKMIEDEQLFYKWVNSLLVAYPFHKGDGRDANNDAVSSSSLAESFPALFQEIQAMQALFRTNLAAYQELRKRFELEWKTWRQEKLKSRSQLQQMETKMERVRHDVASRELFDPQALLLQSAQSWESQRRKVRDALETHTTQQHVALPCEQDLESLKSQLERVLQEISTEYCHARFR